MKKSNKNDNKNISYSLPISAEELDSIIDVTDQVQNLNPEIPLRKFQSEIPHWPNREIYSQYDIDYESDEHNTFYQIYKSCFYKADYIDLKGNINYAYILLHELVDAFEEHFDLSLFRKQIETLVHYYPETKNDAFDYLNEIFYEYEKEKEEDYNDVKKISYSIRLQSEKVKKGNRFVYYNKYDFHVSLKDLSDYEYHLLNEIVVPNNAFIKINLCWAEVCKLYIHTMYALHSIYKFERTNIDNVFNHIADLIAVKHFKHINKNGSYFFYINFIKSQIYQRIYYLCEIKVRETYGYKNQLQNNYLYTDSEIISTLDNQIYAKVKKILSDLSNIISEPDLKTEIILNTRNKNRWKFMLSKLKANYIDNPSGFISSVIHIAESNVNNKKIKNLFYESSKFIANHDRLSALILYLYAINEEIKVYSVTYKQPTKALNKVLFDTNVQKQDFKRIASELLNHKDLVFAISSVSMLYEQRRRKIKLDINTIEEVQHKHSGTVELLNQYLQDESEDGKIDTVKPQNEIATPVVYYEPSNKFLNELSLKPEHVSILELFQKSGFSIHRNEVEAFAKSRRIFINPLIEGINEACYGVLDDILIEENEASFTILPEYFNKILT